MPAVLAPSPDTAGYRCYGAGILGVRVQVPNPLTCVLAIPVLSRPDPQLGGIAPADNSPAVAWREVPAEQMFVGLVDSTPAPRGLDTGREPTVNQLSKSLLVGSAPAAWNALDWLVISNDAAADLGDQWLGDLVATGTGVCVSGDTPPPGRLPWRSVEGGWVLSAPSPGARLGPWMPDAYLPAQAWHPQQPPEFRRQIVAIAIGVAGLVLACAMLKGRRRVVAAVVAAIGAAAGVAFWSFSAPGVVIVQARILVMDDVVRADHWVFAGSLSGGWVRIPWSNGLMPVFASREQAASLSPQLVYDAGKPAGYECVLPPGETLALRRHALLPAESGSDVHPLTASPLRAVAEAYYLSPDWPLRGQLTAVASDQWPPLLVAKRR